ncbi:MAG TPA: hopanoid-associated sugar epimerase, partial [Chthonomonadales bacterium]|nr:hopanoid-associated sugar epimerase [Chthonomonadales bacterium]
IARAAGMTILLTGGSGFIGSHAAGVLLARGHRIRALVRKSSRLDNLQRFGSAAIDLVYGDLTDSQGLCAAMEGCRWAVHAAADYRLWARSPHELYNSNVTGTANLLRAGVSSGVERIVYVSSVGALGLPADSTPGNERTPVSEADMIGHYKRSKFLAERKAQEFAQQGAPVVIVNPSTPVGSHDIKPTPTGRIIVDFLNGRLPAYVDTGLNVVDVADVAAGIANALERGRIGQRYILGNENITLQYLLKRLAKLAGRKAPVIRIPYWAAWAAVGLENLVMDRVLRREPAHPFEAVKMAKRRMFFDSARAVKELDMPQSSVDDALRNAVDWFRANGYAA